MTFTNELRLEVSVERVVLHLQRQEKNEIERWKGEKNTSAQKQTILSTTNIQ